MFDVPCVSRLPQREAERKAEQQRVPLQLAAERAISLSAHSS